MHFTDIFIRRPVLSAVISILILLIGVKSVTNLQVRQYPELVNTVIKVNTFYSGASAETMQGFISIPLQQKIATAAGVEYVTSTSTQGSSAIDAKIRLGFSPETAMTEVMAKVAEVRNDLPADAQEPTIIKETGDTIAMLYVAFSSPDLSNPQITDYLIRQIQPKFAIIPGVSSCDILGGQTFAMRVWLDPLKMAARKVTAADVEGALKSNNYLTAAGSVKGAFVITNVLANTDLMDTDQFRELVIRSDSTALVRLKDVANLELAAESYDSEVILDGKKAVFMGIKNTPESNPLTVVQAIKDRMPEFQKNLPPSLKMQIVYDSSRFIRASIKEVMKTLAEATFIVMIVMLLFLGNIRAVSIPVVTIPLSLIGVCTILLALGFSINLLTLLAMVLAIGLVVDDAIVIVENVHRHIAEGKSPLEAALVGTREIAKPVISMTITLVAVYAPIAFMGGLTGALFKEFALTLAGAVVLSGIIALTLAPMLCSKILQGSHAESKFEKKIETFFHNLAQNYKSLLQQVLGYKKWVLSSTAFFFGMIYFFLMFVPKELAPREDQGFIFMSMTAPQSSNLDYLSTYATQVSRVVTSQPENELGFVINGLGSVSSGIGISILKPWEERKATATDIVSRLQMQFFGIAGINAFAFQLPPLPTGADGMPVQFVISGLAKSEVLLELVEKLKASAQKSGLFMVTDTNLKYNNPEVHLTVNHSKANALGIKMADIGSTLALFMGGNFINRFNLEGRSYKVVTQVPRDFRLNADLINNFYIRTAGGNLTSLGTVLKNDVKTGPNQLFQLNQINSATLSGILMPGTTMGKAIAFLEKEAKQILPRGFSYDFLSESRQFIQEGNALMMTFIFAVIIIFLVLAAQFESFRDPLVVMFSVPLSLFGALLFLFLGYGTLNIYTQIGLVTLVGLITKHGILIVEFANQLQAEKNMSRQEAVVEAATIRLRPILMTTSAMVVGLFPLLIADGAGAASRFSLGLVIVTGMIIGTFFTLFIVPAFYSVIAKQHNEIKILAL